MGGANGSREPECREQKIFLISLKCFNFFENQKNEFNPVRTGLDHIHLYTNE